jgi:sialate O-acetylesterase
MKLKKQNWLLILAGCASFAQADVTLPKVIDSKMVLQRDREVPVWGWADQGEEVTVEFAGQVKKALPDASGKWMLKLDPMPASAESRTMTVKGKNEIKLEDVLVGEVWLASGQSNMEWTFSGIDPEEWKNAQTQKDNRLVRAFHVSEHLLAGVPMDDTIGSWKNAADMVASPQSVSAVGFFFALKLQKELGIPVAFLDSNWGGQAIELFIPEEGYKVLGVDLPAPEKMPNMKNTAGMLNALADNLKAAADAAGKGRSVGFPPINLNSLYGNAPNGIWNAMISPMAPYALRGAIWYQGESNRGKPDYFEKLKALSAGWSSIFQVQNLPILMVQIAPFDYSRGANLQDSTLCDTIWTAQYRASQEILGIGIVPIQDTGINILDIHPKNKKPVGERLADLALKTQYGKDVVAKGPSFASAKRSGSKVVVGFRDIDQGLVTYDGQVPSWFELSADGKDFVPAEAAIVGETVEVSAQAVPEPKFVRMGWRDAALPNLKDKNGWPVFVFASQPVPAL